MAEKFSREGKTKAELDCCLFEIYTNDQSKFTTMLDLVKPDEGQEEGNDKCSDLWTKYKHEREVLILP